MNKVLALVASLLLTTSAYAVDAKVEKTTETTTTNTVTTEVPATDEKADEAKK